MSEEAAPLECLACGAAAPEGAAFCLACGASLGTQARDSVAMDRIRAALAERYPVERKLGEGGMATVYLARDARHNRRVAVKVLRPELASTIGPDRFLREISVAGSLQHPHIVPLLDSGEVRAPDGSVPFLYYVMPYIQGESLRVRLDNETQLPLEDALLIAQEVAGALDYAHRQGVVHRDIKPENIMLSEGHALVADFGIARALGASKGERLTGTGIAIGTPMYMSPEQASGGGAVDARSDIYSLGCVVYEMLAGEAPYTGPTAQSIIAKRFSEPIPQLATVRDVPETIDAAIRKSLSRSPADRFQTAAQMAEALGAPRSSRSAAVVVSARPLPSVGTSMMPASPGLPAPSAVPELPARRRRGMLWSIVVGLALMPVAAALWYMLAHAPSGQAAVSSRVAVFPFNAHGGQGAKDFSGSLVALLSSVLDGVGDLHTVDPSAVLATTGEGQAAAPSPSVARSLAARLGAGRYVIGDIVEDATGRFTISATAYAGTTELRRATIEGSARGEVFHMVNDLAVRLLGAFDITQSPRRLESISTSSIVALNEYLKGESAVRRGEYQAAADAFGRAVEADSLFALAWFRQAYALTFTESPERAEGPAERALTLQGRLSARDKRLAEALSALIQARPEQADRVYRAIVYDYPDDVEGWFGRGDVMLHFGPLHGLAMDSLSQAFERVLFLDPHHSEAAVHLPWAAALDGRIAVLDSATSRSLVRDSSGYYAPVWRILRAFVRRDSVGLARAVASQGGMDDLQRLLAVNMSATLRDPAGTRRLALALLAAPGRQPQVRAFGHLMAAHLALAGGHERVAFADLAAADSLDPVFALEDRALLTLLPFLGSPDSTVRALRSRLERWNAAPVTAGVANPWVAPHDSLHQQIRLYLLGALSARLQDAVAAAGYATALERFDTSTAQGTMGRAMAHEIRGDAFLARNKHAEGLQELDRSGLRGRHAATWERAYSSPFFSQAYERNARARSLSALGRQAEALRWFRSLWMANAFDLVYLAPSELGQAEIYEQQGDRAQALAHYRAFIALWRDADVVLQPAVARAEGKVRQLER